jgi:hypothetical protein
LRAGGGIFTKPGKKAMPEWGNADSAGEVVWNLGRLSTADPWRISASFKARFKVGDGRENPGMANLALDQEAAGFQVSQVGACGFIGYAMRVLVRLDRVSKTGMSERVADQVSLAVIQLCGPAQS